MKEQIHEAGYYVDADITDRKIDKKVNSSHVHVPVLFCVWLVSQHFDLSDMIVGA